VHLADIVADVLVTAVRRGMTATQAEIAVQLAQDGMGADTALTAAAQLTF
jgi:hypothetical protein